MVDNNEYIFHRRDGKIGLQEFVDYIGSWPLTNCGGKVNKRGEEKNKAVRQIRKIQWGGEGKINAAK